MRCFRLIFRIAASNLIVSAVFCAAQTGSSTSPTKLGSLPNKKTPAKLTVDQQRGLRLLQTAESEAPALAPDMHAFVLWRASYAYMEIDSKKAEKLVRETFAATESIEDPPDDYHCGAFGSAGDIKSWIQEQALASMIQEQKVDEVEQLLSHAAAPARDYITQGLLDRYIEKNKFEHAEALLTQVANDGEYPFEEAAKLFNTLAKQHSTEGMGIFNQALNNFQQHPRNVTVGRNDFGNFIEATAEYAPPEAELEAIDKVLDAAKSQDSHDHYSMGSAKGTLQLNSVYEYRLFQLLPVLKKLDKDKAESLLRDDVALQEQLKKYPGGMESLGDLYSVGVTDDNPHNSAHAAESLQINTRLNQIRKESQTDADQALSDALNMPTDGDPGTSPRVDALLQVAEVLVTVKNNPRVAKSALDELSKIEDESSGNQSPAFDSLPQLYLDLGDEEGAKKAIHTLLKAAEKIYAHDTDNDDPNRAFKGTWPSADLWTKCVQVAARISPALAEEIIGEIPDPDIAASVKVIFADSLLRSRTSGIPMMVSDCRKNGLIYLQR